MIDIHAHILPGIDDGAVDLQASLEMAELAVASGVQYLVATPHCNIPDLYKNYRDENLIKAYLDIREAVEKAGIPLQIVPGMEIYATYDLPELLRDNKLIGLNGTKYLLIEFDFDEEPSFCRNILQECLNMGYIPVVAHPERYHFVQRHPEIAFEWYEAGCHLQVNKGSILGKFGRAARRVAHIFLEENVVCCIASDAHSSWSRTPHMGEIREYMEVRYGEAYARELLEDNPRKILQGLPFRTEEDPIDVKFNGL